MVAMPIARGLEALVTAAFYSGLAYMIFDGAARKVGNTGLNVFPHRTPEVVIVTAIHNKPCVHRNGDYLNLISVINKQDYARLHKYKVVAATYLADHTLPFMWNKVGWLLKAYQDYPDAEWYLWVDSDTMVINPSFTLPFHRFGGKDLIVWGNQTRLLEGDGLQGLNSGVMLFRRTQWMKDFLEGIAELGRMPEPELGTLLKTELTAEGYTYDSGLRDQNAIVYAVKKDQEENLPHVMLVNKQYCLNCYWKDMQKLEDFHSDDTKVHFINHFSGCQICTRQNKNSNDYEACEVEYERSFKFAGSEFQKLLRKKGPRPLELQEQLSSTPYCKSNPRAELCRDVVEAVTRAEDERAEAVQQELDADGVNPPRRVLGSGVSHRLRPQ